VPGSDGRDRSRGGGASAAGAGPHHRLGGPERYLVDIRATKSTRTYKEYRRQFSWFQARTTKRLVSELDRSDAMRIFALGREERVKGNPINQKTINKRVIIMLNAMRSQGARIEMRRGDWPKTIEKRVEIYQPEELNRFFR
jgi:hypothetical protein